MQDPLVHMTKFKAYLSLVLSNWNIIMSSCQPKNCTKKNYYYNAIKKIFINSLCGWSLSMKSLLDFFFYSFIILVETQTSCRGQWRLGWIGFLKIIFKQYLFIWLCWVLQHAVSFTVAWKLSAVASPRWPGVESGPPTLGERILSHWTTREVSRGKQFYAWKGGFPSFW